MLDQWIVAIPFVVGCVVVVLALSRWLDGLEARRDAHRRNHVSKRRW